VVVKLAAVFLGALRQTNSVASANEFRNAKQIGLRRLLTVPTKRKKALQTQCRRG
jgi:hypothetical protein